MEREQPDLESRLRSVEDRLAIGQVLAAYPYAVDGLNAEAVASCYTEDAVYEVGDLGSYRGHAEILGIVEDPGHGHIGRVALGVAHLSTPPYVVLAGDRAVATLHMAMVRHQEGAFVIWRVSASRITLTRQPDGAWKIVHRINHLLDGATAGLALLTRLMEPPQPS